MRAKELLHKIFEQASLGLDKRIHTTFLLATETLLEFKNYLLLALAELCGQRQR